jgi:hypothetical protein
MPAIGYDVDNHLFADHSINCAIGIEKCLAIFLESQQAKFFLLRTPFRESRQIFSYLKQTM